MISAVATDRGRPYGKLAKNTPAQRQKSPKSALEATLNSGFEGLVCRPPLESLKAQEFEDKVKSELSVDH